MWVTTEVAVQLAEVGSAAQLAEALGLAEASSAEVSTLISDGKLIAKVQSCGCCLKMQGHCCRQPLVDLQAKCIQRVGVLVESLLGFTISCNQLQTICFTDFIARQMMLSRLLEAGCCPDKNLNC